MEINDVNNVSKGENEIQNPQLKDYIHLIFDAFLEIHGDRKSGDDESIIVGLARLIGHKVVVIGHNSRQASGNLDKISPAAYRKGLRLLDMAESFKKPVIVFIGSSISPPLPEPEQQINESMARYMEKMSSARVPSIGIIMGEPAGIAASEICAFDRVILNEDGNHECVAHKLKKAILKELSQLVKIQPEILVEQRLDRLQNQFLSFDI